MARAARRMLVACWWCAAACCGLAPAAHALEFSTNGVANERNVQSAGPINSQVAQAPSGPTVTAVPDGAAAQAAQEAVLQSQTAVAAPSPTASADVVQERGGASWYARHFQGRRTANGERYDQNQLTAAHKTLPFGTVVRVRSEVNGQEVDVRINDRGPFVAGRVIDLSQAAAKALGMLQLGVKRVTLLLPPGLRPAERSADNRPAGGSGSPSAGMPLSAPQDAPSARALTPVIK